MKERQKMKHHRRVLKERLEEGLSLRCVCGAKCTLVSNEEGSRGFMHPIPECPEFKRTGVPLHTC